MPASDKPRYEVTAGFVLCGAFAAAAVPSVPAVVVDSGAGVEADEADAGGVVAVGVSVAPALANKWTTDPVTMPYSLKGLLSTRALPLRTSLCAPASMPAFACKASLRLAMVPWAATVTVHSPDLSALMVTSMSTLSISKIENGQISNINTREIDVLMASMFNVVHSRLHAR